MFLAIKLDFSVVGLKSVLTIAGVKSPLFSVIVGIRFGGRPYIIRKKRKNEKTEFKRGSTRKMKISIHSRNGRKSHFVADENTQIKLSPSCLAYPQRY